MAEGPTPRQRADGLVERSKSLWDIGRWKDAEAQARRAIEADPSYARAQLQLAHMLISTGRGNEGAQLAKGVLSQDPNSSWAMRILGHWHSLHGRHAEAVALAEQAVRASDGDSVALLNLAYTRKQAGDEIGARRAAEQIVASYPDWPDGHVQLAELRHSPAEAAQSYREALRLDPHNDAALAGLASLSGSMAQYREAVSLAWSALRSDVGDKSRQRLFVRSAWIYLALSRIIAPLRSSRRALSEPFGDACAHAFLSTGSNAFKRLLFGFRFEVFAVVAWVLLLAAMIGAAHLPDALSDKLVPLLGIPVFIGLAVPFFVFFGVIAAARRLLDFRLVQWGGRESLRSVLARAAVSGFAMVGASIVLLLAWPAWGGLWGWLLLVGIVLAVQDLSRWREQWRDSRRNEQARSLRESLVAWFSVRAPRWFTALRLVVFLLVALGLEMLLRHFGGDFAGNTVNAGPASWPTLLWPLAAALFCGGIDAGAKAIAARLSFAPRAERYRAAARTLIELAWMGGAGVAVAAIGGRLVVDQPIEALLPILLVPLIVGGGWLLLRALKAWLVLVAGEVGLVLQRLLGRGAAG